MNWNHPYGNRYSWMLAQVGGKLNWEQFVNDGSTPTRLSSATTLTPGQTYHVVATYDGATIRLYINGQQAASAPASGALSPGVTDLTIGQPDYPAARWQGMIDEFALYPTALTPERITAHYQAGTAS